MEFGRKGEIDMVLAHVRPAARFTVLAMAWLVPTALGVQVDNINGSATPPFVNYGGPRDIGWYYTPSLTYDLTGIFTTFRAVPNGTGSRTVTVQIQSERPVNGGTVLGQGTFAADSGAGGNLGASFAPVHLTAGTTYFVDFLNTVGMGVNLGSWQDVGGTPTPSAGATVNLGTWYGNLVGNTSTNFTTATDTNGAYYATATGNVSFAEPILRFEGTIPEPVSLGTIVLLALGVGRRH
jgi:hypothetical protein